MKILNLTDIKTKYQYDTVNCYEHPRAVALNYYSPNMSNYYIMLTKLYGIYMFGQGENRSEVYEDIKNSFGIDITIEKKLSWKLIKNYIDNDIPVIVGVNLKEIFYSEHYLKDNWVRWIIIKGYEDNGNVRIFDNIHNVNEEVNYSDFSIPFYLLLKANKSYEKNYDKKYSVNVFSKSDLPEDADITKFILNKYIYLDLGKEDNYRQIILLKEIKKLITTRQDYGDYYIEEFKKKIINISKYRTIFFEEIIQNMEYYNYDTEDIEKLKLAVEKNSNIWKSFLFKVLSGIINRNTDNINIDNILIENEKEIQSFIKDYIFYLENNSFINKKVDKKINNITYLTENNEENIIYGSDSNIVFEFNDNKEYNWWLEDNAPKVCIKKSCYEDLDMESGIILRVKIKVKEYDSRQGKYKAGIYLKNYKEDKIYFCSVNKEILLEIDEVGVIENKLEKEKIFNICLTINKNKLKFEEYIVDSYDHECSELDKFYMEQNILTEGIFELGIACKTWAGGKRVRLEIQDIQMR